MHKQDLVNELWSLLVARKRYLAISQNSPKRYDKEVFEILDERIQFIKERLKQNGRAAHANNGGYTAPIARKIISY